MKHYALPPGFDPSVMIDVEALRKELIDEADLEQDESMVLEGEDNDQSTMKLE